MKPPVKPSRTERLRNRLRRTVQPVLDAVLQPKDPSWCACAKPITDLDLEDLMSDDTSFCWRCHRQIEPPSRLDRVIAAFIG